MHSQTSNHPMNMIKAGAQAMFRLEDTEGEEWDSKHIMEDVRESYREAARACWAAMVEAISDADLFELRQHRPTFEQERGDMKAMNDYTRAVLVAATEVDDE